MIDKNLRNESVEEKMLVNFNENVKEEDFKIDINRLNNEERLIIKELINENTSIFAKDKYDIGTVKNYEAQIDLQTEKYCSKRPYR